MKITIKYKDEEIIEVIDIDKEDDDETEKESRKIAERQKTTIKIYTGIIICMIIIAIIVGSIIRIQGFPV